MPVLLNLLLIGVMLYLTWDALQRFGRSVDARRVGLAFLDAFLVITGVVLIAAKVFIMATGAQ